MIDLGDALEEVPRSPDWTADMAYRAASSLVAATPVVLDWDRDAGEDWISLLLSDARVGMISALVSLAIIKDRDAVSIPRSASLGLTAISVPSFDDAILFGDSDRLATVFGSTVVTLRNGVPFSANDLWFATI